MLRARLDQTSQYPTSNRPNNPARRHDATVTGSAIGVPNWIGDIHNCPTNEASGGYDSQLQADRPSDRDFAKARL
jgi:hypothetical protein